MVTSYPQQLELPHRRIISTKSSKSRKTKSCEKNELLNVQFTANLYIRTNLYREHIT